MAPAPVPAPTLGQDLAPPSPARPYTLSHAIDGYPISTTTHHAKESNAKGDLFRAIQRHWQQLTSQLGGYMSSFASRLVL